MSKRPSAATAAAISIHPHLPQPRILDPFFLPRPSVRRSLRAIGAAAWSFFLALGHLTSCSRSVTMDIASSVFVVVFALPCYGELALSKPTNFGTETGSWGDTAPEAGGAAPVPDFAYLPHNPKSPPGRAIRPWDGSSSLLCPRLAARKRSHRRRCTDSPHSNALANRGWLGYKLTSAGGRPSPPHPGKPPRPAHGDVRKPMVLRAGRSARVLVVCPLRSIQMNCKRAKLVPMGKSWVRVIRTDMVRSIPVMGSPHG